MFPCPGQPWRQAATLAVRYLTSSQRPPALVTAANFAVIGGTKKYFLMPARFPHWGRLSAARVTWQPWRSHHLLAVTPRTTGRRRWNSESHHHTTEGPGGTTEGVTGGEAMILEGEQTGAGREEMQEQELAIPSMAPHTGAGARTEGTSSQLMRGETQEFVFFLYLDTSVAASWIFVFSFSSSPSLCPWWVGFFCAQKTMSEPVRSLILLLHFCLDSVQVKKIRDCFGTVQHLAELSVSYLISIASDSMSLLVFTLLHMWIKVLKETSCKVCCAGCKHVKSDAASILRLGVICSKCLWGGIQYLSHFLLSIRQDNFHFQVFILNAKLQMLTSKSG